MNFRTSTQWGNLNWFVIKSNICIMSKITKSNVQFKMKSILRLILFSIAAFKRSKLVSIRILSIHSSTEKTRGQELSGINIFFPKFNHFYVLHRRYLMYDVIGWTQICINCRAALVPHGYVKIKTIRLVGMVLSVFCRRKHLIHVKNMETQYTRLRNLVSRYLI